jgi:hypothetical protein
MMRTHAIAGTRDSLVAGSQDFGWSNAGWHRAPGTDRIHEVQTPSMDALVKVGIELDRHYVYQFCSPTRCAIQTGRNPLQVNPLNLEVSGCRDSSIVWYHRRVAPPPPLPLPPAAATPTAATATATAAATAATAASVAALANECVYGLLGYIAQRCEPK